MTKDYILGVFTTCLIFSCWQMYYMQLNLLQRCPKTSGCSNNCQVIVQQQVQQMELGGNASQSSVIRRQLILLWTPLRDYMVNWEEHFGANWTNFDRCQPDIVKCHVTSDKSLLAESDLILFNMNDLRVEEFEDRSAWEQAVLPPSRYEKQRWAIFWREPPGRITVPQEKFQWLDGLFNWTISYRLDADIFYPFGYFRDTSAPRRDLQISWRRLFKRKGLAWYSNVCETSSRREELAKAVEQMNNGSFVTQLYGSCVGKIPKLRKGKSFLETASKRVKFYLAVEEEICEDYITEVYFDSLHHSYVPVVFGGSDIGYDEVGLAGTYVDALDFDSAKELVDYLKELSASDSVEEFLQYLAWQYDYEVLPATDSWVCDLGDKLADKDDTRTVGDFGKFWRRKKCYGSYAEANFHPETNFKRNLFEEQGL